MFLAKDRLAGRASSVLLAGSGCLNLGYGRFMQTDPLGYDDGLNWYTYVGDDPINFIDPTGTRTICTRGTSGYFDGTELTLAPTYSCVDVPDNYARPERFFDLDPGKGGVPQKEKAKTNPCSGSVRAEGVNFTGIFGLGVTVSFGKVTVNSSGASSWFLSVGVGAGVDAGISGFVSTYRDIGSFSGYGESYNGAVAIGSRTFGGSVSYNVQGERVGLTGSGSGIPAGFGGRVGASGTATDTTLLNGQCR